MSVGKRIRRYRLQKGLSQEDLVREISSIAYLSRIENEKIKPSASFVDAVAERLDIDSSYLVGDSSEAQLERIKEIVAEYNKSSQLSEQDVSLLEFNALEPHEPHILISAYRVLLGHYLRRSKIDQAERVYILSQAIVPQTTDSAHKKELFLFYLNCGTLWYFKHDYFKADHYYSKAEKLLPLEQSKDFADLYYNLSITKQHILLDKSFCKYYSDKAYEIYLLLGDGYNAARTLIAKGVQSHIVGDYDQSMLFLVEALDYMHKQSDLKMIGMIESNIGRVYQGLKQYDLAIEHFTKNIEINNQLGEKHQVIYSYRNLIQIYIETNHLSLAEKYFQEAFQILNERNFPYLRQELNSIYASIYKKKNEDAVYEKEMKKAINTCIEEKHTKLINKLCYELGTHYFDKHNYKKAAYYYKKSIEFNYERERSS
jgi:transcriptional regulator with XRE-family HTH domain